jgi:hypothetical protein
MARTAGIAGLFVLAFGSARLTDDPSFTIELSCSSPRVKKLPFSSAGSIRAA